MVQSDSQFPPIQINNGPETINGLERIVDNFDRRLHQLEQQLNGTYGGTIALTEDGYFPGGITVGTTPVNTTQPGAVTGISATPGSFYENIFCDVEWDEAVGGIDSVSFDVDLALKTAGPVYTLLNVFNTSATNIRLNNLQPNTNYGVRIIPVSNIGVRGATPAWTDFSTTADSTVPPAPSGLVLARGAGTIVAKFTPLTSGQAPDVANGHGLYEVMVDTVNTFTSTPLSIVGVDQVVAFDISSTAPVGWYGRVRSIDSSGNVSTWSATVGPTTAGQVNDSMMFADLSAAKLTTGFLSSSRIATGSLVADQIGTSSLTASTITVSGSGAIIIGNPPGGTGVLINSQGIRLYQSGSTTVILDATTGNATFTGTISASSITGTTISGGTITGTTITGGLVRTASSNQRVQLNGSNNRVEFYNSSGSLSGYMDTASLGGLFGINLEASGVARFYVADNGSSGEVAMEVGNVSVTANNSGASMIGGSGANAGSVTVDNNSANLGSNSLQIRVDNSAGNITLDGPVKFDGNQQQIGNVSAYGDFAGLAFRFLDESGNVIHFNGSSEIMRNGAFLKSFVIDHPDRPETHYLVHGCIEGPEAAVLYRGRGKLEAGRALIELPGYFESLTIKEERTVNLTPIYNKNKFIPKLAAGEVEDGVFEVHSDYGFDSSEFYWEVKAVRADIPTPQIEVNKKDARLTGDGPYTYLVNN